MKNPFKPFTPMDFKSSPENVAHIKQKLSPHTVSTASFDSDAPAPKPPSATHVGLLVVMLDRAYQSALTRRETLEAAIAEQQEQLRQTNTAISSIEAAMMVAAVDPALTLEEAEKANAAADRALGAAVEHSIRPPEPLQAKVIFSTEKPMPPMGPKGIGPEALVWPYRQATAPDFEGPADGE